MPPRGPPDVKPRPPRRVRSPRWTRNVLTSADVPRPRLPRRASSRSAACRSASVSAGLRSSTSEESPPAAGTSGARRTGPGPRRACRPGPGRSRHSPRRSGPQRGDRHGVGHGVGHGVDHGTGRRAAGRVPRRVTRRVPRRLAEFETQGCVKRGWPYLTFSFWDLTSGAAPGAGGVRSTTVEPSSNVASHSPRRTGIGGDHERARDPRRAGLELRRRAAA